MCSIQHKRCRSILKLNHLIKITIRHSTGVDKSVENSPRRVHVDWSVGVSTREISRRVGTTAVC